MSGDRWTRVEKLVQSALARPAAEREAFVREACAEPNLVAEVLSLVARAESAGRFLEPAASNRAPLEPGRQLGPYRIEAFIDDGGMGEVYRARDTRLNRIVALKVLPGHVRSNPQLLARFEREAQAIAALNHPHICILHDVGRHDDIDFLVMEHIEGETLRNRLRRGPLPVDKTARYAGEIADALAAAHKDGLVHRDIKPSNIVVTTAGHVKVIDFGLARLTPPHAAAEKTREVTEPGALVGTPDYMSPEQVQGRPPDPRTDIFALGIVLFECLTGQRPFAGETPLAVVSAILKDTPPAVTTLKPDVPEGLARIVGRCLEKDPNGRYQSARDLRHELEEVQQIWGPGRARSNKRPIGFAVATLGVVAAAGILYFISNRSPEPPRYRSRPFATAATVESMPAWSPDGLALAYVAEDHGYSQIFTRPVDGSIPTPILLARVEADCWFPTWDSTGTRIFFLVPQSPGDSEIWSVSRAGGAATTVVKDVQSFALAPDDTIVFIRRRAEMIDLWTKDPTGERLIGPLGADLTTQGRFLSVSPDGHWLGIGLSDGFRLIARPLDVAALQRARTVRFRHGPSNVTFFFSFAWMPDSRRVVFSGREGGNDPQLWVGDSASGTAQPLGGSSEWELLPAVSRNGTVAYASTPMDWDILQVALDSPRLQPLVTGTRDDSWPSWVPRTNELVFTTSREGHFEIWKRHLAGVTEQVLVTPGMFPDGPTLFLAASSVSPNGEQLAFTRYGTGGIRIYFQALQGKAPVRLTNADAQAAREDNPAWSPNSKWIVFRSGPRVLKAPATAGAVPITVATDSVPISLTAVPKWVGDEIIYQSPEGLRRVPETGGSPTTLSSLQPLVWDPEPGGTILAILKGEGAAMVLVRIDMRSGAVIKRFPDLGRVPLTPDPLGYARTIRSLRVSPDGKRVALAYLNPRSDIWILEGLR